MRTVRLALRHPGTTLALAALLLVAVQVAYGKFGHGVEFFPKVEPDYGQVIVHAPRQPLARREGPGRSPRSRSACSAFHGLKTVYTRVGEQPRGSSEITEDTIGVIQFEFADWKTRAPAHEIMDAIRASTADIPGILVEVTAPRAGPPTGKPIQVQLAALDPAAAAGGRQEGRGDRWQRARHPRSRRRPAAARHRLEDRGRQGGGRQVRRRGERRRHGGAARHQRPQGDRISPGRERQGGRHPGAVPGRQAQPRPDGRAADPDRGRPGADRQFRASGCRRRASAISTGSPATA